jgi:formate C-acetyltransferase
LWQVNHGHNGLGRLDLVLAPYYQKDLLQGKLTYNDAKIKLKNMVLILGKQTRDKSAMLIGDTGQYILLGGIGKEGENIDNDLTQMFLEIFEEIRVPDPKLIIRVNEKTTDKIWHSSMKCLFNGCGSPLLMNETLIMNKMVSFGYAKEDVWNFGTSACWEPLVIGKSSDQNNPFQGINLCDAIQLAMECGETYSDYDAFLKRVVSYIEQLAIKVIKDLNIDYSPLMSLFLQDCWNNRLDFAHKGSKYMYQGAQVVGLPNLVNSLLNIKEFVFEKKVLSLEELNKVLSDDYIGHDDIRQLFLNKSNENFGKSSEEILNLSNNLIAVVGRALDNVKSNDSKVKYGLSSPGYMYASKNKKATPDGRKFGMPYAVHISPVSSDIGVSEVLDFATHLDYPVNCLNGNVVDFIIPVAYQKHLEKLTALVKNSFQNGLFQLQLNVLDKATLIDAKAHPEKYPNLVVRVWGFSAYFNDLPEEFKNNLIARAEMYESA